MSAKASELSEWHHRLTGSCELGREVFMRDNGIVDDDEITIQRFIELTENVYWGGDTIKKLK